MVNVSAGHVVVAINPSASFGSQADAGRQTTQALESAGYLVTALQAPSFELLQGMVHRALAQSPDALIVVGGDGMVSLAVNAVAQTSIPFGVIPAGTGNDFARGVGIPVGNILAAIAHLQQALKSEPVRIDLGRVTSADGAQVRWFAGILSAGFDALVNERANLMKWPRGKSRYIVALVRELIRFRPQQYSLLVDGVSSTSSAMLIAVANNSSMGGGMQVAPHATLQDGRLDLFILKPLSKLRLLWLFPKVFSGRHVTEPEVLFEPCSTVTISGPRIAAYADGERVWGLPVEIDIVPSAVRLLGGTLSD